ncbi:MAG TPA: LysR family transcriptional regulator [Candidatus Binatia bacterium]|jgi:DNA-binding transcriptional LysR family regulator
MKFNDDLLKTYIAICDEGGFSSAAETLHKSQPGVSFQIASLERRARLKLFDRSERPPRLTEAGAIFLQFAREVVNKSDEVDRSLKELSIGAAGEVNVGASSSVGAYLLSRLVSDIKLKHPNLSIFLATQQRERAYDAVRDAAVDFAFVLTDKPPDGLVARPLRDEPLYFVASPKYPLSRNARIAPRQVRKAQFVMGPKNSEYTAMVNGILQRSRISTYSVALRISNFEGIKEAVRAGAGICLLPLCAVKRDLEDGSLVKIQVQRVHLSAKIMLIERLRASTTPTLETVKKLLIAGINKAN